MPWGRGLLDSARRSCQSLMPLDLLPAGGSRASYGYQVVSRGGAGSWLIVTTRRGPRANCVWRPLPATVRRWRAGSSDWSSQAMLRTSCRRRIYVCSRRPSVNPSVARVPSCSRLFITSRSTSSDGPTRSITSLKSRSRWMGNPGRSSAWKRVLMILPLRPL